MPTPPPPARTGSRWRKVFVAPGDDGGPMTNGVMHTGTILPGDLDLWTFSANSGDALVVRIGETGDTNTFTPWVRLYGPNGKLLDSGFNSTVAEVTATATNTGTFLVVVGNGNGVFSGSGTYRLALAKTGDPVVVSAGDDGGPMTNGFTHLGTIATGDLDLWAFKASSGDALIVRIGGITFTNSFTPWIRLYGPNGKLLSSGFGAVAGEVSATATNSGTFLVVAGDGNGAVSGSGDYRLTLAKTGDPIVISTGDEGGAFNGNGTYDGTLDTGDVDEFYFTACVGDSLALRMDELVSGSSLTPWLRLYGGTTNGTVILFSQTNLVTPLAQWTPLLTNQFDAFGVFSRTNVSNRYEAQRYFRLQEP